jgi:hypothetical protein
VGDGGLLEEYESAVGPSKSYPLEEYGLAKRRLTPHCIDLVIGNREISVRSVSLPSLNQRALGPTGVESALTMSVSGTTTQLWDRFASGTLY